MAGRRALILCHASHEDIAGFRAPIEAAGFAVERVHVRRQGPDGVDLVSPDLVVVMGGPMAVYERERHPWITRELALLADRLAAARPTLGVCLGAQLIAAALGAEVYSGPVREVGFAPVTLTEAGERSPLARIADLPLLHFHGDTFDLPAGAVLLARTRHCAQAFAVGRTVLALQCHPEMGEDPGFDAWLRDEDYLAGAGTTAEALRRDYAALGPAAVAGGRRMLSDWLAELDRGAA